MNSSRPSDRPTSPTARTPRALYPETDHRGQRGGLAGMLTSGKAFGPQRGVRSMQSIDAVLEQAGDDLGDEKYSSFDKLIEAYEKACADADYQTLLCLPLPADPEDIWSEVEDVVVRNAQWGYLQRLMEKFGKTFDTDFLAEILTSGYEDEQKVCVIEIALHCGWDINCPKSNGGYILSDALDDDTDMTLRCLLNHGANPNLGSSSLVLDTEEPLTTSTDLPLQDAVLYGTLRQIHMLLHYNANPDLANGIHSAIRSEQHEVWKIKLLLSYGADQKAIEWAGNPVMTALLHDNGIKPVTPFVLAAALNKAHVVQFLLDPTLDPNEVVSRGIVLPGIKRKRKMRQQAGKEGIPKVEHIEKGRARAGGGTLTTSLGKTIKEGASVVKPRHVRRSYRAKRSVRMHTRG